MTEVKMCNYIPENTDVLEVVKDILQNNFDNTKIIEYSQNTITYTINYKIGDDKIVFLVSYGKPQPKRCYNRNDNIYDDSILSDNVIHLTNQFIFVIYKNKVLCSDHNKRNVILNLLHEKDKNLSCNLLAASTSIEDFIKQVKSIESISITAIKDLFINEFINPDWGDDFDEEPETPETTVVKMEFKRALKDKYLIKLYKKLQTSYIKAFNIKGETSDGFITINEASIIAKETFELEKKEGYYEIEEIFNKI